MADNTGFTGEESKLNGRGRVGSTVGAATEQALSNIDMDEVRSQAREVIRAADELRRTRPLLFWGTISCAAAILTYLIFRPARAVR